MPNEKKNKKIRNAIYNFTNSTKIIYAQLRNPSANQDVTMWPTFMAEKG